MKYKLIISSLLSFLLFSCVSIKPQDVEKDDAIVMMQKARVYYDKFQYKNSISQYLSTMMNYSAQSNPAIYFESYYNIGLIYLERKNILLAKYIFESVGNSEVPEAYDFAILSQKMISVINTKYSKKIKNSKKQYTFIPPKDITVNLQSNEKMPTAEIQIDNIDNKDEPQSSSDEEQDTQYDENSSVELQPAEKDSVLKDKEN